MKKSIRRIILIVNYSLVVSLLAFFYGSKLFEIPNMFFFGGSISIVLLCISFYIVFIKTDLWKITHQNISKLDERQTQVVLRALKYSYSIFAVSVLVVIYLFSLFLNEPVSILLAACLLYFAHTLPATILGWTENYI